MCLSSSSMCCFCVLSFSFKASSLQMDASASMLSYKWRIYHVLRALFLLDPHVFIAFLALTPSVTEKHRLALSVAYGCIFKGSYLARSPPVFRPPVSPSAMALRAVENVRCAANGRMTRTSDVRIIWDGLRGSTRGRNWMEMRRMNDKLGGSLRRI